MLTRNALQTILKSILASSLAITLIACSGGGGDASTVGDTPPTSTPGSTTPGSTTPGSTTGSLLTAAANPINLTLIADSPQRAGIATIGTAGGSISATGSDGTSFRLDIPANALPVDTTITMTPLVSIPNLPLNSLGGAVSFAPEGLQFYKTATLTIVPAKNIPLADQVLFGFSDTGQDMVLASPANMGSTITVAVTHFSGTGVGNGTSEQKANILKSIANRVEARIESAVANELSEARKNGTTLNSEALNDLMREYEASVVRNRITAAGAASATCADGQNAINTYLGYERQRALMGVAPSSIDFVGLLQSVMNKCRAEAVAQCKAQSKTEPLVQFDLKMARQYALMGLPSDGLVKDSAYYTQTCLGAAWVGTATFETTGNIAGWWGSVEFSFALDSSFQQTGQARYKLQTGKLVLNYDASRNSNCTGTATAVTDLLPEDAEFTIDTSANTYRGLGIVGFGRPPLPVTMTCPVGKNSATITQDMSSPALFFGDPPDGTVDRPISADGTTITGSSSQNDAKGGFVWRWTLTRQ